jgi:hypothetical protein
MKKLKKDIVTIENITFKINEEIKTIPLKDISFYGFSDSCDCCGGHGGVNISFYMGKKYYKITVGEY